MNEKLKQLKFQHQLALNILNGTKTTTFRFFDDKNIRVGDQIEVIDKVEQDNPVSWQVVGVIVVTEVREKLAGDVHGDDWEGHELYENMQVFMDTARSYYKQPITDDTPIKIVRFTFDKYDPPSQFLDNRHGLDVPKEVKLYADGGSRGNPGPSAGGFVILDMDDNVLRQSSKYLGITTNNQAEYHALKGGLELCLKEHTRIVHAYMDSLLVVNQMKSIFKIKNRELWPIHEAIKKLVLQFESVNFTHVPREMNRLADAEVNKALDALKNENRL